MTPVKLHHGGLAAVDTQLFVLVRTHLYCDNGTGSCLVPMSHEVLQCLISTGLPQPTPAQSRKHRQIQLKTCDGPKMHKVITEYN